MGHHIEKSAKAGAIAMEDTKTVADAGLYLSPEEDRRILRKLDLW